MGRCMTVLILSFTIFLFLSITISSSNSLQCKVGTMKDVYTETCKNYENKCKFHVTFNNKNEPMAVKGSCAFDNQGLGCYYAAGSQSTMECTCNTNLCNTKKLDDDKLEECKYLGKDGQAFTKVERVKEASKCYYKSSRNVETGGPMAEHAGVMSNEECKQIGIPDGQKCMKTFLEIQDQWTETVLCCCEGEKCNDISPNDIPADSKPPLKCHSTDNKQYCHGTAGKQENAVCWYQAKLQANDNTTTTEAAAKCIDKSQCSFLNPGDGGKCNVTMQDSDTITVDCCCKETECNTHEQMQNEVAKITTLPKKCYVYSNEEAKVSKWCTSNTCSYKLKKAQDSNDQISEEGSCKEDSEEECNPEDPCTSDVSDEDGKAVITINCCCTKDNCNTQDSAELDQPIKDIKVPERDADKPQAAGAMSFFSQLLATTIIGVSVLIAAVQHLHIGI